MREQDGNDRAETRVRRGAYMSWADDCAIPVAHHDIVAILEAVRARAVADALLALLELLEQPEIAWYCSRGLLFSFESCGSR